MEKEARAGSLLTYKTPGPSAQLLKNGMKPEEFQHSGAFKATMNRFLGGYDSLVQLIRGYMIV